MPRYFKGTMKENKFAFKEKKKEINSRGEWKEGRYEDKNKQGMKQNKGKKERKYMKLHALLTLAIDQWLATSFYRLHSQGRSSFKSFEMLSKVFSMNIPHSTMHCCSRGW
jgi:hypothetical protein